MAAITVIQPPGTGRGQLVAFGEGQAGLKTIRGVGKFNGTDATGTLVVPGLSQVFGCQLSWLDTPQTVKEMIQLPLGTISADHTFTFRFGHAGTVTAAAFTAKEALATDDTNYYDWGLVNKGAAGAGTAAVIDAANDLNSTKTTGGAAVAAYTPRALTLGAAADRIVAAGDVGLLTVDENGAVASFTESLFTITVDIGGTDEVLNVVANSDGTIPISSGAITIARTGNVKTSAGKFAFTVFGR